VQSVPITALAQATAEAGSPSGVFAKSTDALSKLQTYSYTVVFSFTSDSNGKPESGSMEVHGAVAGSDRLEQTWKDLDTGDEFGVIRIGSQAWALENKEWTAVPASLADAVGQSTLAFAPSMSWGEIAPGIGTESTYVGVEILNGVSTKHYTTTYNEWSQVWKGSVDKASGDVWIADAGYPVRYRFTAEGTDDQGNKGSVLWTMDINDVNGSVTIEPPATNENAGD